MATKKKLLQAAAGSASGGAGALNVEDVFSTYLYEGNGSSQVIENGINLGQSNSGGAAKFNNNNTIDVADSTDFAFGGGDWTVEAFAYPLTNDDFVVAGWGEDSSNRFDFGWQQSTFPRIRIGENGVQYEANASTSYDISNYLGTWVHLAAVRNGNTVTLYLNGTSVASVSYSEAGFPTPSTAGIGIGSRWYTTRTSLTNPANGYISNFRIVKGTAVYTSNFTVPTSALTAITNTSLLCLQGDSPLSDNSGNSHTLSQNQYNTADVTASNFGPFDAADANEGGLVWIKGRTGTPSHALYDTERGANSLSLSSDDTGAAVEVAGYDFSSFNSNGFTVSARGGALHNFTNDSGRDFASWTFRKAPKFFDVVTWTGDGTGARTISHNLGSTPGSIIRKKTSGAERWYVWHRSVSNDLSLNETTAASYIAFNLTDPTSTEFTVSSSGNISGETHVAYLFAHNDGDGEFGPTGDQDIIKCGNYVQGTSSYDVDLGFEPQWVLIKSATSATNWMLFDNMRGLVVGGNDAILKTNTSAAEENTDPYLSLSPNGFTSHLDQITGNQTYIYIAIRRGPMAVPTAATDVFAVETSTSGAPRTWSSGFPVDLSIYCHRDTYTSNKYVGTRLTGNNAYLVTNGTSAEGSISNAVEFDYSDKIIENNLGDTNSKVNWMWKRAPSFFDAVAYTGNGTAGRTVSHNLGVAPEMMWVKHRNASDNWAVYHKGLNGGTTPENYYLNLDTTAAESTQVGYWNNTAPTASNFTLGTNPRLNDSAGTYIAYLFASLDGVSKVGSYTATGNTLNIDCGFTSGARFVLIKNTGGGNWYVYDTARGIVSGNDPALELNSTSAEDNQYDSIDPYSAGFTLTAYGASSPALNEPGETFIFYAIA